MLVRIHLLMIRFIQLPTVVVLLLLQLTLYCYRYHCYCLTFPCHTSSTHLAFAHTTLTPIGSTTRTRRRTCPPRSTPHSQTARSSSRKRAARSGGPSPRRRTALSRPATTGVALCDPSVRECTSHSSPPTMALVSGLGVLRSASRACKHRPTTPCCVRPLSPASTRSSSR